MVDIRWKRLIRWSALFVGWILMVFLTLAWLAGSELIAPRNRLVGELPGDVVGENIELTSADGIRIVGWHLPSDDRQGVVVLLHGIGGSRLQMLGRGRWLRSLGYSVVMIDFRGHGESAEEYVTAGYLERHDVKAGVDFARRVHPGEPIGVIGVSMGGAAAVLASPLSIDALVLESVYPDIERAVGNRLGARSSVLSWSVQEVLLRQLEWRLSFERGEMMPVQRVADVGCPVLIASGDRDRYTPEAESIELSDAAREPKLLWLVEGAGHVDLESFAREDYRDQVGTFLRQHMLSDR